MARSGALTSAVSVEPPIARRRGLVRLDSIKHHPWDSIHGGIYAYQADGERVLVQAILNRTAVLVDDHGIRVLVNRATLWVDPNDVRITKSENAEASARGRQHALRSRGYQTHRVGLRL